jgi:putative photosynthetic complex assembly protein
MPASTLRQNAPREKFPRAVLLGAGAGLVLAIVLAFVGRMIGPDPFTPTGQAIVARELAFRDLPDGAVGVYEANSGAEIARLEYGTNSFIRATLRGLVRERRMGELGPDAPFRLAAWNDGRLTLEDTATGRIIDIVAFGTTQAEAFARLLHAGRNAP